jgi:serine protease DegQ
MRFSLCAVAIFLGTAPAWADDKPAPKSYSIPYKLTFTNHVMVRAKINGKGPFNFIVDTGAPALFVATKVAEKVGTKPDRNGWGTFDKFELEGGLVIEKASGKIDDPFQLEGMNGMGLAGLELHGMIGYNVLAKYKITYDFTSDKLVLTELPGFDPGKVPSFGGGGQGGLEIVGKLMKILGPLLGLEMPVTKPRGFLGLELDESKNGVTIKSVLPSTPAEDAGLRVGDKLVRVNKDKIDRIEQVLLSASKSAAGKDLVLTIERDGTEKKITVTLGKGL